MSEPIRDVETAVRELGALPMPAGPVPSPRSVLDRAQDALDARMAKDDLRLVLENVIAYAAELERRPLAWAWLLNAKSLDNFLCALSMAADTAEPEGALAQAEEMIRSFRAAVPTGAEATRAQTLHDHIVARDAEIERLRARIASLEAERHTTNEAVSEAAEALRRQRDRIAEAERLRQQLLAMLPTEPCIEYGLPNELNAAKAEYGAWEQVADALGVALPYRAGEA